MTDPKLTFVKSLNEDSFKGKILIRPSAALPEGFHKTATTGEVVTAMENPVRKLFGLQFHPEVAHTPLGKEILRNFLFGICGCKGDRSSKQFISEELEKIRATIGLNFDECWQRRAPGRLGNTVVNFISIDDLISSKRLAGCRTFGT